MTLTTTVEELTPIERLSLRETLQEKWRLQLRRLTLLSLAMYDDPDAEEPTEVHRREDGTTADALARTREELARIEDEMRQLDVAARTPTGAELCGG